MFSWFLIFDLSLRILKLKEHRPAFHNNNFVFSIVDDNIININSCGVVSKEIEFF
jgi:hypothetical protein